MVCRLLYVLAEEYPKRYLYFPLYSCVVVAWLISMTMRLWEWHSLAPYYVPRIICQKSIKRKTLGPIFSSFFFFSLGFCCWNKNNKTVYCIRKPIYIAERPYDFFFFSFVSSIYPKMMGRRAEKKNSVPMLLCDVVAYKWK